MQRKAPADQFPGPSCYRHDGQRKIREGICLLLGVWLLEFFQQGCFCCFDDLYNHMLAKP